MSRGLSEQQRTILATLAPDHLYSVAELGALIHGPAISRSEYESLRRAVHSLERRELIADNWWRMAFVGAPKRYGLPAAMDRREALFLDYMERQQQKALHGDGAQHIEHPLIVAPDAHATHNGAEAQP